MPAVPSCILNPLWDRFAALLPNHHDLTRWAATASHLAAVPAPANRRDDGLLAASVDSAVATLHATLGPLPTQPVVHLDAGYDCKPCRQALADR